MELQKKEQMEIEIMKESSDEKGKGDGEAVKLEQRISFFGSISKNRETTWVISLFVFVHIVAFLCTMIVNNCWTRSHGQCTLMFFQPLPENPLLGPSSSVLDHMGALRRMSLTNKHGIWRLFTALLLHAGAFHLIISISSVILIGINLEQKFGPSRTAIVYILSACTGSLMAALFVQNNPEVCSSGALFGLIGASVSGIIRDWTSYTNKFLALTALFLISLINFALGLLPYVDNYSNVGGFVSGFLLGFVLFFSPRLRQPALHKGLFDYGGKTSVTVKEKLDLPVLRIVSLFLFCIMVAGLLVAVFRGINVNKYCSWCQYIDCVPSRKWICDIKAPSCKTTESGGKTALVCLGSDKYRNLPFTNITPARLEELCSLICS